MLLVAFIIGLIGAKLGQLLGLLVALGFYITGVLQNLLCTSNNCASLLSQSAIPVTTLYWLLKCNSCMGSLKAMMTK